MAAQSHIMLLLVQNLEAQKAHLRLQPAWIQVEHELFLVVNQGLAVLQLQVQHLGVTKAAVLLKESNNAMDSQGRALVARFQACSTKVHLVWAFTHKPAQEASQVNQQ